MMKSLRFSFVALSLVLLLNLAMMVGCSGDSGSDDGGGSTVAGSSDGGLPLSIRRAVDDRPVVGAYAACAAAPMRPISLSDNPQVPGPKAALGVKLVCTKRSLDA